MFLGKSGKNKLEGKDDIIEQYTSYVNQISQSNIFKSLFLTDNLDNFNATSLEFLQGNYTKVLTNLSLLHQDGELSR